MGLNTFQSEGRLRQRTDQRKRKTNYWNVIFIFGIHRNTHLKYRKHCLISLCTLIGSEILARRCILPGIFSLGVVFLTNLDILLNKALDYLVKGLYYLFAFHVFFFIFQSLASSESYLNRRHFYKFF